MCHFGRSTPDAEKQGGQQGTFGDRIQAGDRRRQAGDRRETGGRQAETGGRQAETGRRQEEIGGRQVETGGRQMETGDNAKIVSTVYTSVIHSVYTWSKDLVCTVYTMHSIHQV